MKIRESDVGRYVRLRNGNVTKIRSYYDDCHIVCGNGDVYLDDGLLSRGYDEGPLDIVEFVGPKESDMNEGKINESVDNMTALCEQGREQVKDLLRTLGYLPEKAKGLESEKGQVWKHPAGDVVFIAANGEGHYILSCIDARFDGAGNYYGSVYETPNKIKPVLDLQKFTYVADSPEEYFQKKFNQEL